MRNCNDLTEKVLVGLAFTLVDYINIAVVKTLLRIVVIVVVLRLDRQAPCTWTRSVIREIRHVERNVPGLARVLVSEIGHIKEKKKKRKKNILNSRHGDVCQAREKEDQRRSMSLLVKRVRSPLFFFTNIAKYVFFLHKII